jgi:hypothetical protein
LLEEKIETEPPTGPLKLHGQKRIFQQNGIHICADYMQIRAKYRYLTKAWGWPDGTQSRAPGGVRADWISEFVV